MLVASIVGVDMRATMDIDTTVKALTLNENDIRRIITEVCDIPIEDGITFEIMSLSGIMEKFEYPGIRIALAASMERLKQTIKIDISTDDVITPAAVEYQYKLMFEDRYIKLISYNRETLLAEKIQTVLARGIANTRLRDFYDIYEVTKLYAKEVEPDILLAAFEATCKKRDTVFTQDEMAETLMQLREDSGMKQMWDQFCRKNYYVGELEWNEVVNDVVHVITEYILHS